MRKTRLAALLAAALLLCGCSCGQSLLSQNVGTVLDDWRYEPAYSREAESHTTTPYDNADFAPTVGFSVTAYPNTTDLWPDKFFAIDDWCGQLQYTTAEGLSLVVRVAEAEGGDRRLAGTYYENHYQNTQQLEIDGIPVNVGESLDGCAAFDWQRDGFSFLLHSNKSQGMPPMAYVEALVTTLRAEKA